MNQNNNKSAKVIVKKTYLHSKIFNKLCHEKMYKVKNKVYKVKNNKLISIKDSSI